MHHHVESRLWELHGLLNNRYRRLMDHHDAKKAPVEKRKAQKHYADFIKTSQFFYKGFIQRLASHFAGMTKMRRIANCMSLSTLSVDQRLVVSTKVAEMVEAVCYDALLHLGDLSRYRNAMRTQDRSWAPALGYYHLAQALEPNNGSVHNQIAVIHVANGKHSDAILSLYQAIAVKHPHPLGRKNLELELKKVTRDWSEWSKKSTSQHEIADVLFVRLHASLYKGAEYTSWDQEIEDNVLTRIPQIASDPGAYDILVRWVLINIGAVYVAEMRVTGKY